MESPRVSKTLRKTAFDAVVEGTACFDGNRRADKKRGKESSNGHATIPNHNMREFTVGHALNTSPLKLRWFSFCEGIQLGSEAYQPRRHPVYCNNPPTALSPLTLDG